MNKFLAKKTIIDGITFDSKKEAQYYLIYKHKEQAGMIKNLNRQVDYPFKINNKTMFKYKADFTFEDENGFHIIDVKSSMTSKLPVYRLKKKIIEEYYQIKIEEVY